MRVVFTILAFLLSRRDSAILGIRDLPKYFNNNNIKRLQKLLNCDAVSKSNPFESRLGAAYYVRCKTKQE